MNLTTTHGVAPGCRSYEPSEIVGASPLLLEAVQLARLVAPTSIPVLIIGETGTGKELLAHLIHTSALRSGPFVAIDCGALPADLMESLLFGHRRGSFTGAVENTQGLITEADGGTLLLDELGSLAERSQAKLLRVLETGAVRRVGDSRTSSVGFRLVSTVQPGLKEMVVAGQFREDLFQRVAGVVVRLPSLRERGADVVLLARAFAARDGLVLSDQAAALLAKHDWPGNVRELKWTMARCALFVVGNRIDAQTVEFAMKAGPNNFEGAGDLSKGNATPDPQLIAACLMHGGDATRIAECLGIGRSTLYRRLRRAGASLNSFRNPIRSESSDEGTA